MVKRKKEIGAIINEEDYYLVKEAFEFMGVNMSNFFRMAVIEKARKVLVDKRKGELLGNGNG